MENSFLGHVAEEILSKYGQDLRSICIVMPNKRAAQFLYKELAIRNNNKPIWAPVIKTSVQLLREYSTLINADRLVLLNELFKIHTAITGRIEPLHKFFPWGEILLADFNDIDKYRVPAQILYTNLTAEKEITLDFSYLTEKQLEAIRLFWGEFAANEKDAKAAFTEIWQNLYPIYDTFRNTLFKAGMGYEGMIYRDAADKISKNWVTGQFEEYILVGFNQLDSCERELFDTIITRENHSFYWDYDQHYVNNQKHEAGLFARKNKKFHSVEKLGSFLKESNANIYFLATSTDSGQAQWIGKIMQENHLNPGNTGIILPKEEILPSLLTALPAHYPKVNITMGYPIYYSSVYPLAEAIFNVKKRTKSGKENTWYYIPYLKKIFQNPYIQSILSPAEQTIIENWKLRMYVNKTEILEAIPVLGEKLFNNDGLESYYIDFLETLALIQINAEDKLPIIDKQIIPIVYKELRRLHELVNADEFNDNPDDQLKIIQSTLRSLKVPFIGEPVEGLQIMGPLESRSLDFENVIIPNMNEGAFPGDGSDSTYIPHSLRQAFGMPGPEEKLAAQAYFFYRLLHKAKNVYLLFNTEADGLSSGEKSRYLWQLENELAHLNYTQITLSNQFVAGSETEIIVDKTPAIMEELLKYTTTEGAKKSISPTALSSYLSCSLKFYFNKIAKLKEDETLEDEVDSRKFGNILHETLENLYIPYKGKTIQAADLKEMKSRLNEILDDAFNKAVNENSGFEIEAENIIIRELIKEYALKVLNNDESRVPFKLIATELGKNFDEALFYHLPLTQHKFSVRFFGIVDRIDEKNGVIEIIDYKTGKVDLKLTNVEDIFSERKSGDKKAILQTFIYEEMYKESIDPNVPTQAGIYSLKEVHDPLKHLQIGKKDSLENIKIEILNQLQSALDKLYNPDMPFVQTKEISNCIYCEFRGICNRI